MHTVAVSGLHLAFLLGFLRLFIGNRRMTAIIGLPMMVVFVVMAGCSPSVLRAAFMTALVLFAPLLGRENDPPTSLLTALAILLAANPFAAASISLQLSFASMAGLFCVSGALYRALDARLLPADVKLSRPRRKIRAFFSATTASSVGAMVFTVPLTALHFGNISLIAPVTNLLILWLLPAAFIGCYLTALLGLVWAWGGTALAWVTAWPLRYILAVANVLSKLPGAVLFTGSRMVVWWLALVYAMFGAAWLLSRRRKVRYWIPAACSVLALCAVLTVNAVQLQRTSTVTALDVSQGQSIVFSSGRSCAVVDCGGRSTAEDPGDLAARKLLAQGHRSLDLLVLTHPHDDHVSGVLRLMHWLPVRTLVIPAAADITQAPLSDILALAEANHTTVVRVDAQQTIAAGGIYTPPRLVYGTADANLEIEKEDLNEGYKVMEPTTANRLRAYMESTARYGTGISGAPQNCTSGIKTGTAQTGVYAESGDEILNYWYAGYICDSDDAPAYTIVILEETAGESHTAVAFQKTGEALVDFI